MIDKKEIQVFVSCPSDVECEKDLIIKACDSLTESMQNFCKFSFRVREWRSIIGQLGIRPQSQINERISNYDIFIGIFWMRFGTPTGMLNPETGKEYESGTEEEFHIAFNNWEQKKVPSMFLFFRDPKSPASTSEIQQLLKVSEFKDKQKQRGWVNPYRDELDFYGKIYTLLNKTLHEFSSSEKAEVKASIAEKQHVHISKSKVELIVGYVSRSLLHYSFFHKKKENQLLDTKTENLNELINIQRRLIILGDAGSGKSTELRNLAYELSKEDSIYIPIFQQLNSYTTEQGLENYLPDFWKEIPQQSLVIIWDGLDEIQPHNFNTTVRQLKNFSEKYNDIRIVVSSRTNFYELPTLTSSGTLDNFEPYFIKDMSLFEIRNYFLLHHNSQYADKFIKDAFKENLDDLIKKPFFLMLLEKIYTERSSFSMDRSELYEMFIESRISFDAAHYINTYNIRERKQEILFVLEKVALGMEILAKNVISEDELLQLISSNDFALLKFTTAYKKQSGSEWYWEFEHQNIQEYLAARVLSRQSFSIMVKLISFEPTYNKVIPSWVNTLTFLFSILKGNDSNLHHLTKWLLENDKEIIVKFEREKIPLDIRKSIFTGIFNYYKFHDLWINSNKFSDSQLARFGQSSDSIEFILEEINSADNTKVVKLNAARLAGSFVLNDSLIKGKIEIALLRQIKQNTDDPDYVHNLIYTLKDAELTSKPVIDLIVNLFSENVNQYLRGAIYSILLDSGFVGEYPDFLIKGLQIVNTHGPERGPSTYFNESFNLSECIKAIKNSEAIIKIFPQVILTYEHSYLSDKVEVITALTRNAINAYAEDNSIFELFYSWYMQKMTDYDWRNTGHLILFFTETNTRHKAFLRTWCNSQLEVNLRFMATAALIGEEEIDYFSNEYNNRELTKTDIQKFYNELIWLRNSIANQFEEKIRKSTGYVISKPEYVDFESQNRMRTQADFDILFDVDKFRQEVLRVFDEEEKLVLTFDDLFEVKKINNKRYGLEEHYSGVAIQLLRNFCEKDSIDRVTIVNWFSKDNKRDAYLKHLIWQMLYNDNKLIVSDKQKTTLEQWTNEYINSVNFRTAITICEGNTSFNWFAIYVWFYYRKFDFDLPKEILLDMISFYYYEENQPVSIDFIIKKLNKNDVDARIEANIKEGINDEYLLKWHVEYILNNHLLVLYPIIVNEIRSSTRDKHTRKDILDIYWEKTKDIETMNKLLLADDKTLRWSVVKRVFESYNLEFLEAYLINVLRNDNSEKEQVHAAEYLIKLQNLEGLDFYTNYILNDRDLSNLARQVPLHSLNTIDAIPYLIRLLELSYTKPIVLDHFENLNSIVLGSFVAIGLASESNLEKIKSVLMDFMMTNKGQFPHANKLIHSIERMEAQFYLSKAQSFNVKQARDKIRLIAF